jgi:hypothetical protein
MISILIDLETKQSENGQFATASVYGLKSEKRLSREGLGALW